MNKKDIHNLIEQQDPDTAQRILQKVRSKVDVNSVLNEKVAPKPKKWKWAVAVFAVVCVALAIVLPLTLNGSGERYCTSEQYTTESLGQTLRDYSVSHNNAFLYTDWYDTAEEVIAEYAHLNDNNNDIVYWEEVIINGETGSILTLSITDNKTRVDKFEEYYVYCEEFKVGNVVVKYKYKRSMQSYATFEYNKHIYYLQLEDGNGQEEMIEIIQGMLNCH